MPSGVTATPRMFTGSPIAGGRKTGGHSNEGENGFTGFQLWIQSVSFSLKPRAPALVSPPIHSLPSGASVSPNQSLNVGTRAPSQGPPMQTQGWTWAAYQARSARVSSVSGSGGGK